MPIHKGEYMPTFDYVTMCEANYAAAQFERQERERFESHPPMPTEVDYTDGEGGNASPLSALLTLLFVFGGMALVMLASMML